MRLHCKAGFTFLSYLMDKIGLGKIPETLQLRCSISSSLSTCKSKSFSGSAKNGGNCNVTLTSHQTTATPPLTDNNQLRRLLVRRPERLKGASVVASHIPGRILNWQGSIHLLWVLYRERCIQMWLELLQRNRVGVRNPLVNGEVVEEPFQDDSSIPWVRLVFTVEN